MQRHPARRGIRDVVVVVLSATALLALISHGALAAKNDQTQVIGKVGNSTVYDQTVNGDDKSDAVKTAEANAAAAIHQQSGQCGSRPKLVSKTKSFEVVQVNSQPCDPGVLDCNGTGGSACGTTSTTEGQGAP